VFVSEICKSLDVKLNIVNLQTEYEFSVISYMTEELMTGRTPNPDVLCNSFIKFGEFVNSIPDSFTHIASGHYAIKKNIDDDFLFAASDEKKDQSFFLSGLSKEQIKKCIFPIGNLTKPEVRKLAEKMNLCNKNRPDSQGLCFLGKINYSQFVKELCGTKPGLIVNQSNGHVLGKHDGIWTASHGQRFGLNVSNGPWYVTHKCLVSNTIYVTHKNKLAKAKYFSIHKNKFESPEEIAYVKYRHPSLLKEAHCDQDGKMIHLRNESEIVFVPGQICAVYSADKKLLGNCVIK
jgi:tRNA-specific 2-thiouridylase